MQINLYTNLIAIEPNWILKLDCFLPSHSHKAIAVDYIIETAIKKITIKYTKKI